MALSRNEKYVYVNISFSKPAIHVWTLSKPQLIQKWTGNPRGLYRTLPVEVHSADGQRRTLRRVPSYWERKRRGVRISHLATVPCTPDYGLQEQASELREPDRQQTVGRVQRRPQRADLGKCIHNAERRGPRVGADRTATGELSKRADKRGGHQTDDDAAHHLRQ